MADFGITHNPSHLSLRIQVVFLCFEEGEAFAGLVEIFCKGDYWLFASQDGVWWKIFRKRLVRCKNFPQVAGAVPEFSARLVRCKNFLQAADSVSAFSARIGIWRKFAAKQSKRCSL
jgi:hypothetical protein